MEEFKKEDLKHGLTVGKLLESIEKNNISKDAFILNERVEDSYFTKKGGWKVYLMDNMFTSTHDEHNKKVLNGEYLDKNKYPNFDIKYNKMLTKEHRKNIQDQYIETESVFEYNGILFIRNHY